MRCCDNFVMGLLHEADARRMLAALTGQLAKFKHAFQEKKTRLMEFGKLASELSARWLRGATKPFYFLGFRHYCATA